jgi:hypothetical protein
MHLKLISSSMKEVETKSAASIVSYINILARITLLDPNAYVLVVDELFEPLFELLSDNMNDEDLFSLIDPIFKAIVVTQDNDAALFARLPVLAFMLDINGYHRQSFDLSYSVYKESPSFYRISLVESCLAAHIVGEDKHELEKMRKLSLEVLGEAVPEITEGPFIIPTELAEIMLDSAWVMFLEGRYDEAINIFSQIGKTILNSSILLRSSCLLSACYLESGDDESAKRAVETFSNLLDGVPEKGLSYEKKAKIRSEFSEKNYHLAAQLIEPFVFQMRMNKQVHSF